jgi:hypothetical protein
MPRIFTNKKGATNRRARNFRVFAKSYYNLAQSLITKPARQMDYPKPNPFAKRQHIVLSDNRRIGFGI